MKQHSADCSCCEPRLVRLQHGLWSRMRSRPYYSPDEYARAFARREGETVTATHTFEGPGGVYAYSVEMGGKSWHLPALYADPVG